MKSFVLLVLFAIILSTDAYSQSPEITSWILNTTGQTGFGGIPSNIQQVQYSVDNVYVSATCIPGYDIGPWNMNPNTPVNQNFVYKITRHPQQNTGTLAQTPLGHIGVWTNGVSIFNAKDARSYKNQNVWNQNAIIVEGASFDECLGHPAPNGEYHHHLNPRCLYDDHNSTAHSPIIGFAFDGYPVYGAYGYANIDGTGGIHRMNSSYRLRSITDRTTLPDGTVLSASQYGPALSAQYPLGYYIEDFEYITGLGDLDEHNGRWGITPEYPEGTYAYFVTVDADLTPTYPYTLGLTYYGAVPPGNTGPGGGHNTISESVTTYNPANSVADADQSVGVQVYPNPASTTIALYLQPYSANNVSATLVNVLGEVVWAQNYIQPSVVYGINVASFPPGIYLLHLSGGNISSAQNIVIAR